LTYRGQIAASITLNLIMNSIASYAPHHRIAHALQIRSDIHSRVVRCFWSPLKTRHGIGRRTGTVSFDRSFSTNPAGTGMELTICRSISHSHGGTLRASAPSRTGRSFMSPCRRRLVKLTAGLAISGTAAPRSADANFFFNYLSDPGRTHDRTRPRPLGAFFPVHA